MESLGAIVNPRRQSGRVAFDATTGHFPLRHRGLACAMLIWPTFAFAVVDMARAEGLASPQVVVSACRPTAGLIAFEGHDPKTRKAEMNKGATFVRAANVHMSTGNLERAIEQYDRAIDLNPDNALYYYARGQARSRAREFGRALDDFHQATRLNPASSMAFFARGQAHAATNEYERAIEDTTEAIKLLPGNSAAYVVRGGAYIANREYDRAIEDISQAVKMDPLCYAGFYARGTAYDLKCHRSRAIADYGRAIELSPAPGTIDAFIWRNRAHSRKGDYDHALQDIDQALKLDPRDIAALSSRCYVLAIAGAFDKALAYCNEALRIRPNTASILDSRGFTYLKMGSPDEAIAAFDAALQIDRKMASSLYGRGTAKRLKGDAAGGDADIEAARAIRPSAADEMAQIGIN